MRSLFLAGLLSAAVFAFAAAQTPADRPPPEQVGASLKFEPTRLVLGAHRPRGVIRVTASEDVTVDLAFIDRVMTEQGAILDLAEAKDLPGSDAAVARLRSAQPLLAPVARRLHLRPGQSAEIEVALAQPLIPSPAAEGEQRTHLTVSPVAPAPADPAAPAPTTITWRYALPMIVRGPDTPAKAALAIARRDAAVLAPPRNAADDTPDDTVDIEIRRAGEHSLYGDLIVKGADGRTLAALDGLAVYPEIDRRIVRLQLPAGRTGPLEVQFVDRDTHPGAVLARLPLPQAGRLAALRLDFASAPFASAAEIRH